MQNTNPTPKETLEVNPLLTNKVDSATLSAIAKKSIAKKLAAKKSTVKKSSAKKEIERKLKTKVKNFIYKFQLSDKKLSAKDEKKLRSKLRRKMQNIVNSIIVEKDKSEAIKEFEIQYKKEYVLNDYSFESLSSSNDETKREDFEKVLSLVKSKKAKK